MTALQFLNHLLNFVLPAAALALLLPWAGRWLRGKGVGSALSYRQQVVWQLALGCLVLVGGLLWGGADGRMATYATLALAGGTLQWLLLRGWRG